MIHPIFALSRRPQKRAGSHEYGHLRSPDVERCPPRSKTPPRGRRGPPRGLSSGAASSNRQTLSRTKFHGWAILFKWFARGKAGGTERRERRRHSGASLASAPQARSRRGLRLPAVAGCVAASLAPPRRTRAQAKWECLGHCCMGPARPGANGLLGPNAAGPSVKPGSASRQEEAAVNPPPGTELQNRP